MRAKTKHHPAPQKISFANYAVRTLPRFEREAAKLSKKYASFADDLEGLIERLQTNPQQGTSLGKNFYKVRLSPSCKNKGKSGGARVITFVVLLKQQLFLAAVYDKSEQATISDKELKTLADVIASLP